MVPWSPRLWHEPCNVRGRVGIAVGGKVIGEVTILRSMKIAERSSTGSLIPVPGNEENFPLLVQNHGRHRVDNFQGFLWKCWRAWEVGNPVRYEIPQAFTHKTGVVRWIKLLAEDAPLKKNKRKKKNNDGLKVKKNTNSRSGQDTSSTSSASLTV